MENYENNNATPETEDVVIEIPVVEEIPVVVEIPVMEEIPVEEANPYGQDFASYETPYMSKKEYLKSHAPEGFYKTIKTWAIVSYVLIAINVVLLIFNPLGILDIALMLGLTLGIHLKKSKGCVIALLIYGIFNFVVGIIANGAPMGILWLIAAIVYLVQFNKAEKEYKAIYGA